MVLCGPVSSHTHVSVCEEGREEECACEKVGLGALWMAAVSPSLEGGRLYRTRMTGLVYVWWEPRTRWSRQDPCDSKRELSLPTTNESIVLGRCYAWESYPCSAAYPGWPWATPSPPPHGKAGDTGRHLFHGLSVLSELPFMLFSTMPVLYGRLK